MLENEKNETEATVDITDVFAKAVKVKASEIKVGDFVFDTFGGTHEVTRIRELKDVRKIIRDDGMPCWWEPSKTVTIVRGEDR